MAGLSDDGRSSHVSYSEEPLERELMEGRNLAAWQCHVLAALHHQRRNLSYGELLFQLHDLLCSRQLGDGIVTWLLSRDIDGAWPDQEVLVLKYIMEILIDLRDYKNEHLAEIPFSVRTFFIERTLEIKKKLDTIRFLVEDKNASHYVPFALFIKDRLNIIAEAFDVILHRHFVYLLNHTENQSLDLMNHTDIPLITSLANKIKHISSPEPTFSWSHNKNPADVLSGSDDKICVICTEDLNMASDFAVLDVCNHLLCAPCAEVALMGNISHVEENPDGTLRASADKPKRCPYCAVTVSRWSTSGMLKLNKSVKQYFSEALLTNSWTYPRQLKDLLRLLITSRHLKYGPKFSLLAITSFFYANPQLLFKPQVSAVICGLNSEIIEVIKLHFAIDSDSESRILLFDSLTTGPRIVSHVRNIAENFARVHSAPGSRVNRVNSSVSQVLTEMSQLHSFACNMASTIATNTQYL